MTNSIKNVVVVGASGNVGKEVARELIKAGFNVTIFTRQDSTATFPENATVKKVDYQSVESLASSLEGQDALVSTIATVAVGSQKALVDAAIAAKVKRFISSEFGINTRTVGDSAIGKILQGKIKVLDYIIEKSEENPWFTWNGVSSGLFFDWGLRVGSLGFNKDTKSAVIYDSGNEPVQGSNLAFIGRAVVAILSQPQKTANQYLSIASFNPSQNQILEILENETGEKWKIEHASTAEQEKIGLEKLGKGDFSAFSNLLRKHVYADGANNAVKGENSANGFLGLQDDDLATTLNEWLRT
ncbi:NAD(P)-binding protein [Annulohypoxylon maeteangense]|uniref:NAD(P)-binding protein n=1 Tax=Annulohypoxylon maeteangense TaxID=1927788 RepID=UPI0020087048|nr:NAD(P)-binding protein [Annulohypoxylon maeteangense]KAI0881399.1 NAD(P)-binding protein [Annulohypoxylon maeteangense]